MRTRRLRHGLRPAGRTAAPRSAVAVALVALVAGLATGPALAAPTGVPAADPTSGEVPEEPVEVDDTVRLVHANIYTKLTVERFQADVREVLAQEPDFVTYNEVPFRNDAVIAPAGYDLHRDPRDRFTKATPVAWRSDRWSLLDAGVHMISDHRGKPPGREVELGRRWANWVTLQGTDGRVLSVVSVHVAPVVRGMPDLLRPSVTRLVGLTDRLAAQGPVLVGGDFNVHYRSGRYPRDIVEPRSLVPTFDTLGGWFPTGDHRGATIDYVFVRGSEELLVSAHRPVELFSDHDAVVADLTWQSDAPVTTTTVENDPSGTAETRVAVRAAVSRAVDEAAPGSIVHVVTQRLDAVAVVRQLRRALARDVRVRILLPDRAPTRREKRTVRLVSAAGVPGSWVRRCGAACQRDADAAGLPPTLIMVSDAAGHWARRYDVSQPLSSALVQQSSRLVANTGTTALQEGRAMLRALR